VLGIRTTRDFSRTFALCTDGWSAGICVRGSDCMRLLFTFGSPFPPRAINLTFSVLFQTSFSLGNTEALPRFSNDRIFFTVCSRHELRVYRNLSTDAGSYFMS
jgi:hypothetical protein